MLQGCGPSGLGAQGIVLGGSCARLLAEESPLPGLLRVEKALSMCTQLAHLTTICSLHSHRGRVVCGTNVCLSRTHQNAGRPSRAQASKCKGCSPNHSPHQIADAGNCQSNILPAHHCCPYGQASLNSRQGGLDVCFSTCMQKQQGPDTSLVESSFVPRGLLLQKMYCACLPS